MDSFPMQVASSHDGKRKYRHQMFYISYLLLLANYSYSILTYKERVLVSQGGAFKCMQTEKTRGGRINEAHEMEKPPHAGTLLAIHSIITNKHGCSNYVAGKATSSTIPNMTSCTPVLTTSYHLKWSKSRRQQDQNNR